MMVFLGPIFCSWRIPFASSSVQSVPCNKNFALADIIRVIFFTYGVLFILMKDVIDAFWGLSITTYRCYIEENEADYTAGRIFFSIDQTLPEFVVAITMRSNLIFVNLIYFLTHWKLWNLSTVLSKGCCIAQAVFTSSRLHCVLTIVVITATHIRCRVFTQVVKVICNVSCPAPLRPFIRSVKIVITSQGPNYLNCPLRLNTWKNQVYLTSKWSRFLERFRRER